jgi:hypothetical protein
MAVAIAQAARSATSSRGRTPSRNNQPPNIQAGRVITAAADEALRIGRLARRAPSRWFAVAEAGCPLTGTVADSEVVLPRALELRGPIVIGPEPGPAEVVVGPDGAVPRAGGMAVVRRAPLAETREPGPCEEPWT